MKQFGSKPAAEQQQLLAGVQDKVRQRQEQLQRQQHRQWQQQGVPEVEQQLRQQLQQEQWESKLGSKAGEEGWAVAKGFGSLPATVNNARVVAYLVRMLTGEELRQLRSSESNSLRREWLLDALVDLGQPMAP